MITREQLELAAKAAGHTIGWGEETPCQPHVAYIWDADGKTSRWWRPHTDPGDAARLAVRLNIKVVMTEVAAIAGQCGAWAGDRRHAWHDSTEPDKIRAWCEAVVKCAAAVGERMQLAGRIKATPEQIAGSLAAVDEYDAAKKGKR